MTELSFKGKEFVYNHHLSVPFHPLVPHAERGIGDVALDGNLIIQGDNLKALKALLPMYAGKVDCIFIDPPYNTGNEGWGYNDNVNAPMIKEWLDGNPIGIDDGLRHDKWCAMMWPRLRLLHELLSEEGTLFVSIDDNENQNLRSMLDEIFGENGFVAEIVWRSADSSNHDAKRFSMDHNTIFVFSKNPEWVSFRLDRREEDNQHYTNPDNDPKGPWFPGNLSSPNPRENLRYTVDHPDGRTLQPPPNGWRWGESVLMEKIASGEVEFSDAERGLLRKTYLKDQGGLAPSTLWDNIDETGHNRNAKYELKRLFPELNTSELFATPKPTKLIDKILKVAAKENALVLDSFAGSGTTAHAVLKANKQDNGSRRFILVEMEDYANEVTAERVRRVISGYEFTGTEKTEIHRERINWRSFERAEEIVQRVQAIESNEGAAFDRVVKKITDGELVLYGETRSEGRAEGLGGEFTFCTLGDAIEMDTILTGESLPAYDQLGAVLFHMATNRPLETTGIDQEESYLGESEDRHVWLIYQDDLDWLKSKDAALTLSFARKIADAKPDKAHLVFAPARFVSQKLLNEESLQVEFAPLPFALYRVERD